MPDEGRGSVPLWDATDDPGMEAGSWLRVATVLASSYVVPPIMNTITSCGLYMDEHKQADTLNDMPLHRRVRPNSQLSFHKGITRVFQPTSQKMLQRLR